MVMLVDADADGGADDTIPSDNVDIRASKGANRRLEVGNSDSTQ